MIYENQTTERMKREEAKFKKVLNLALKEPSLPKFKYENNIFTIKRWSKSSWKKYLLMKKKEWLKKYNNLQIFDFEDSEPSTTYLAVEIAYDTPHHAIRMFFYNYMIDLFSPSGYKFKYEDKI
jgi:seryl-tRNA synthetase